MKAKDVDLKSKCLEKLLEELNSLFKFTVESSNGQGFSVSGGIALEKYKSNFNFFILDKNKLNEEFSHVKNDFGLYKKLFKNKEEIDLMGESEFSEDILEKWKKQSDISIISTFKKKEMIDISAFLSILIYVKSGEITFEISKFIVNPEFRRIGFSEFFIRSIVNVFSSLMYRSNDEDENYISLKKYNFRIIIRVDSRNENAYKFCLEKLRYVPLGRNAIVGDRISDRLDLEWFEAPFFRKKNKFSEIISNKRKELGLSQVMLAQMCGLTKSTINQIEKGKRKVSIEKLATISMILEPSNRDKRLEIYTAALDDIGRQQHFIRDESKSNLWIATDSVLETQQTETAKIAFNHTIEALINKKQRYYFISNTGQEISNFIKNIEIILKEKNEDTYRRIFQCNSCKDISLDQNFRIYRVPRYISSWRAVFRFELDTMNQRSEGGCDLSIGISDNYQSRAKILDSQRARSIFSSLEQKIISYERSVQYALETSDSDMVFRRVFPPLSVVD